MSLSIAKKLFRLEVQLTAYRGFEQYKENLGSGAPRRFLSFLGLIKRKAL